MEHVRIVAAASAHPPRRVSQAEAAALIGGLASDSRRVAALARATGIEGRNVAVPPEEIAALGGIAERNAIYHRFAAGLARRAVTAVLGETDRRAIGALVTSSCTGYSVPGWGTELVEELGLPVETVRLPVTEAGCSGGAVALARAVDYLRTRPEQVTVTAAVELCSLAFHGGGDEGNLVSSLIFGDGAGAALLAPGAGPGLEILDTMSVLLPGTRQVLGFDLTDHGFYPVLTRELADILPAATVAAASRLLSRNGLGAADIDAWLLHPGGARILAGIERALGLAPRAARWSWESMREFGNTSSAAIFDVLARYLSERLSGHALIAAFGPGVSIELLLARAC